MNSLLCQSKEQLAPGGGRTAIEAERELIEVVIEMIVTNGALMGAQEPAFEQRDNTMNPGQQVLAFRLAPLHPSVVPVALQPTISIQAIRSDRVARFNCFADEAMQARFGQICNVTQADSPYAFAILLRRNCDQCFLFGFSPT